MSNEFDVHADYVEVFAEQYLACPFASLALAGSDPQEFDAGDCEPGEFWENLVMLAYLSNITAVRIEYLNVPSDGDALRSAVKWFNAPTVGTEDEHAPPNQSLLVFDHPGLDLGTELTRRFQEMTHTNRTRFAFPDRFFESAARWFGGQVIRAEQMGYEITKSLRPEEGTRQDELRLALLNTTSYRAAMTARSSEYRNEFLMLIDGHRIGAIDTLRQMMLNTQVGLTEEHLQQVWRRANERGVALPDLPVQWLPPDR